VFYSSKKKKKKVFCIWFVLTTVLYSLSLHLPNIKESAAGVTKKKGKSSEEADDISFFFFFSFTQKLPFSFSPENDHGISHKTV
jgi:hypothetical protein